MIAFELVRDRKTKEPAAEETGEIRKKCLENGLILMSAGVLHNIFRFMFPLVIKKAELEKGLDILENAIKEVNQTIS